MKAHHFTEYRHKDYRIPRSMKEAYGWDAPLWIEEDPVSLSFGFVIGVLLASIAWILWFAYGWL